MRKKQLWANLRAAYKEIDFWKKRAELALDMQCRAERRDMTRVSVLARAVEKNLPHWIECAECSRAREEMESVLKMVRGVR